MATLGWSGPYDASSIASARRIKGSASPSRFVAHSSDARLLRSMATSGVVRAVRRLVDRQCAVHQGLGLTQPVRGLQAVDARLLRSMATSGVVRAVRRLVDRQCAAHQGLGLTQPVRGPQQFRQVVEVAWRRRGGPGRTTPRRSPVRGASRARPHPAGSWPATVAPGC